MMDEMNFDPNDIAKIRQLQALGPLQASNQAISGSYPGQSFDNMPSPLDRGASEDAPGLSVPPPPRVINRSPAVLGPAKPEADDDSSPVDVGDDVAASDDAAKGFQKDPSSSLKDLMVTKDDLEGATKRKKIALALGMMGEALANGQSAGNFYLGKMSPHHDVQNFAQKMAGLADAPIEQKKVLMAQQLKQPEMELAMRSADPGSTESVLMGNMMKANIQNNTQLNEAQKAEMLKNVEGKSASELNQIANGPLFKDQMANDKLFQTLNNKVELANTKAEMMRQLALDRGSKVGAKDQMKTLKETQNAMEQMRGDPSTQQAEKDIYAADKADTLMNMYGDPNKLSRSQVQLVVGEVGKIAQGGSPTIHELEGLNPNTFQGNVASAWGKVVNDPQPANLASFVKQYQDYANGVTKDAENHVLDRYKRIIEPRRDYLSEADQTRLDAQYTHRFDDARKKRADKESAANPKMSDEDAAAFQHIKDQPNDTNAGAIAQVLKKKYPNLVK